MNEHETSQPRPGDGSDAGAAAGHPKIRFNAPSAIGGGATPSDPSPPPEPPASSAPATIVGSSKIRTNERAMEHGEHWARKPNVTGEGATHVRTFHSKLNNESLAYLDQQVNDWLDEHPEYEVKFVNSTIGVYTGKTKEPALICQVWV